MIKLFNFCLVIPKLSDASRENANYSKLIGQLTFHVYPTHIYHAVLAIPTLLIGIITSDASQCWQLFL